MNLYVGTSGYSYKEWKGTFYPEDLPDKQMLRYYGERFRSVEINNTFYRMPKESVLEAWAAEVSSDFRFVIKASQRITHEQRLKDTDDSVSYLLKVAIVLKERLGPLLFQLPPFFKQDVPRLRDFLRTLPSGCLAAFEFRHASWFNEETYRALREARTALVVAESEDLAVPVVATADWGYLRLRREDYEPKHIADWAARVRALPWQRAFVYFKHEDRAVGPQFGRQFVNAFALAKAS